MMWLQGYHLHRHQCLHHIRTGGITHPGGKTNWQRGTRYHLHRHHRLHHGSPHLLLLKRRYRLIYIVGRMTLDLGLSLQNKLLMLFSLMIVTKMGLPKWDLPNCHQVCSDAVVGHSQNAVVCLVNFCIIWMLEGTYTSSKTSLACAGFFGHSMNLHPCSSARWWVAELLFSQ